MRRRSPEGVADDVGPSAILSVLVSADTQRAAAELSKFDAQVKTVQRQAEKGIEARLGAHFDPAAFSAYEARLSQAARRTADRKAFRAELGANFNNVAFNAYERAVLKAQRETEQLVVTSESAGSKMRTAASKFFTGGSTSEERSFARGTLRGAVGRGAGFLGSGLAGGLVGYLSASGLKNSIEGTTQMVKQAEILAHYTGLAQQSAMEFEGVAGALGVSSRSLAVGFRTLATQTNNALTDPTKASTRAFKELGLSQAEVKAHANDLGSLFGIIADRLNAIPAGAERTALATKLMGRNWQQLAPFIEQGSKGMKDQLAQAKALGVTIGGDPLKNIQKLHEAEIGLKLAQEGLSVQFTEHVAPALISVTMGAIKLAETVRKDLGPVFKDLSPIVKDVGHLLEQNKTAVEDLALAFVGLKVIRTVGGWFGGLYNDAKKVWEIGGKLAGLFTEQGAAAASEAAPVNELAAAYERLALAQKEAGIGGIGTGGVAAAAATQAAAANSVTGRVGAQLSAGGIAIGSAAGATALRAGPMISWALPALAAALPALGIYQGAQAQMPTGRLARELGSVPGTGGLTGALKGGITSVLPFASGFLGNYGQLSAAQEKLKQLQAGLAGVTSATQLTDAQLGKYGQIVAGLLKQPDMTATQRKGLAQLAYELKPTTVAFQRATAAWSATFQGFDATAGGMSAHFRDQLAQDSRQIAQNWTQGTKKWTQQTTALTAAAWQQIQQLSAQGVSGVAQDIQSLLAMLDKAQITATKAGASWLSAVQANLGPLNGLRGTKGTGGSGGTAWNIATHAKKAAAAHEHWNPFTNAYELMTSAQATALRDQYIATYGKSPASGPSHARATSLAASTGVSSAGTLTAAAKATLIPSQTIQAQIQMAQLANRLAIAQNANNVPAQAKALNAELKLEHQWLSADRSKLAEVNAELKNHNLGYAKHNQLLADKLSILQEIGSVVGQINSTQSSAKAAATVGEIMPKIYYHDQPRPGRHQAVKSVATSGSWGRGPLIGQLVVNGNNMNERQMMDELYLKIRPHLTSPAG